MKRKSILVGKSCLKTEKPPVRGGYVDLNGEQFYRISNFDQMPPFLMSIVSDSDHWMYISSNGGLTAGRKNPDNALFPYYTDDKIHDSQDQSGSRTIIFVAKSGRTYLWEPLSQDFDGLYRVERNLYKNVYGNKLIFEEINRDLSMTFRYGWSNSERFGFIKHSHIVNHGRGPVAIRILDGIQNLLPYGINRRFQMEYSTLADGYKKNELQSDTGLGIFMLSSIPVDKAEPSEALKATTVWSAGLKNSKRLISSWQLDAFRRGLPVKQETDIRAARGAYFVNADFRLLKGEEKEWYLVADINQDASDVVALTTLLKRIKGIEEQLLDDVARGTENLVHIVAGSDGLQSTGDALTSSRHFSNVLFNVMRGGIFENAYVVDKEDFVSFITTTNKSVAQEHSAFLQNLPQSLQRSELLSKVVARNSVDLEKLCYEYLPLTFSRRHGDPSRPWNFFSVEIKGAHGEKVLNYQGNWRDIFQNWEALALSFPEYVEGMIAKFVNASTADGYNPYRVTRDGFDWEVLDPHDAWSYIGYWGDHQVIYLLKLLEISARCHPGKLQEFLIKEIFAYANVPYRIKPYRALLKDPRSTIEFDMDAEREIQKRVRSIGTDGKFARDRKGRIVHVTLTEKLLLSVLTRLSNFIPGAGLWMNTQRPEWNDANNALVGLGVSVVTLCYLRRYAAFCRDQFQSLNAANVEISEEVADLLASVTETFKTNATLLGCPISNKDRKRILDRLGEAGSDYRNKIYTEGVSERKKRVAVTGILEFFDLAIRFVDHTIKANRRKDNLFHAYNLMKVENDEEISIQHLYEMLEGQVAVLSSGHLSAKESLEVLDALRNSALFRKDQSSYMLYPNRQLPRFDERNNIPIEEFKKSELLKKLVEKGDRHIVIQDINGGIHFNGSFRNANVLKTAVENLKETEFQDLVQKETQLVLDIYERIFDHRTFTGRSGTFYKYEGLGCIYWHMVSKFLLAVQEVVFRAQQTGEKEELRKRLIDHYYAIRGGIGAHKPPELYGAFPTDPYSHTPGHIGVQQPGMTGQVKEDIISRFGELGVHVENGKLVFKADLLKKDEFLKAPKSFHYTAIDRKSRNIDLEKGTLAFTYCQVPIVYHLSRDLKIRLAKSNGDTVEIPGLTVGQDLSSSVFKRNGDILRMDVYLTPGL